MRYKIKGSYHQRGKSWMIQVYTGKDVNGKYKRYTETVGSEREAKARLKELMAGLDKGVPIPAGTLTVAEHLHNWLEGYCKTNCSARTLDGYKSIVECHLIPTLGNIKLKHLQPPAIQEYYSQACENLSARTVHHQYRVLSESLKYAVRQGYLGRNPAEFVDAPKPRKTVMRSLTATEVAVLLESVTDHKYYPVIYTALNTGLRQAELLGLRWRDIDLDMASISVSRVLYWRHGVYEFIEPKTDRSSRSVRMTPKLACYLREYKLQREALDKKSSLDSLVFGTSEGKPFNPNVLSHEFARIVKRSGLPHCRFHDLRHTFASLMLQRGAKPKVISEALGHSSVAFTMDTYSHIMQGMQEDAMSLLDEVLPAGVSRNINNILTTNTGIMASRNK